MASPRNAVNGIERLVTRSLAIVAIAIAAGGAHSWMRGPLDLLPSITNPPPNQSDGTQPDTTINETSTPNQTSPPAGETLKTQVTDPTSSQSADALPEGHITVAQAYDHFINGTADFIDARAADKYAEGHIPGAHNLSLEMTQDTGRVQNVLLWLDTSKPIVIYCQGGLCSEAKDVGRLLSGAGFGQILIIADGFPGWKDAGYLVDTGSGQ